METALTGVRILDLSRFVAGPFASTILADLGAEVIKVEPPTGRSRAALTFLGEEVYFLMINRNKKSLALDLKTEQGREIFLKLVEKADVVLDNFRPGVMEKLGLDYDWLRTLNPRIISCSVTGFSPQGRYRRRPAYDLVIQAMSGAMSVTGHPGGPPAACGVAIADYGTAMFAAHGILAALYARERAGTGQRIEVTLLASQLALLMEQTADYLIGGVMDGPSGGGEAIVTTAPPYGTFKTRDGYIAICGHRNFKGFCQAVGKPEWLHDPRFSSPEKRRQNREEFLSLVRAAMESRTTEEWVELLEENDIPVSPVNDLERAFRHPAVANEEMLVDADFRGERIKILRTPMKMSSTPPGVRQKFGSPPLWGQHTDEILANLLGYSEEKLVQLRKDKIIFGPAP